MLAAYNGRVRNGKPVIFDNVTLPENASLIITVEMPSANTKAQQQGEAIRRFMSAIDTTDNQFTEDDFSELENNRANFSREVDL
jgi:hypothetical protein